MRDLEDFIDPTLRLPIRGKTYVVESPDAALGLKVQQLWTIGAAASQGVEVSEAELKSLSLDDDDERDLLIRLLGATYDQMRADGVPWAWVRHAGVTVMFWVAASREAAEAYWESPGETQPSSTDPLSQELSTEADGLPKDELVAQEASTSPTSAAPTGI